MSIRLPAPARREQLLATALEVFARQGFHATSMNDVAEAAGVTKPVLYQHFDSKRELYLALLEEVGGRLLRAIGAATVETADPRLRTERGFAAYFRWVAEDHDSFLLLFGSGARRDEEFAEAVRRVEDQIAGAIAPLITADIDRDHRRTIAYALVGLAEGASRELVQRAADFDPELLARQVADLAWAGLRALRPVDA
ncbi:MAG TPA: helix-turn-helix domain-containing protein [Acidimicrobiales bacterium]|jgi:AcrR family transcriptional regulator|nr:helix-turn-helix domain-containing protein [Acidimicrobiales bacterium]